MRYGLIGINNIMHFEKVLHPVLTGFGRGRRHSANLEKEAPPKFLQGVTYGWRRGNHVPVRRRNRFGRFRPNHSVHYCHQDDGKSKPSNPKTDIHFSLPPCK